MIGEYLSEIVDVADLEARTLNLITAPCGSGKTYFAKTVLKDYNEWYRDDILPDMLYLIDSAIGKEQLLHSKGAKTEYNYWTGQEYWVLPDITVMTYAGYATLCNKATEHNAWKNHKCIIVCDELQNAVSWSKWQKEDNIHDKALGIIAYNIEMTDNIVVCITATPKSVLETFSFCTINEIPLHGIPRHYENKEKIYYSNLTLLLKNRKAGQRGIVYIERVAEILKYKKILDDRGIKTAALWSKNNEEYPLSSDQIKIREAIIHSREMPEYIDVLFLNKSCKTSISIGDEERTKYPLDFMIVHHSDKDTQIQVRGRYRNDLNRLYLQT